MTSRSSRDKNTRAAIIDGIKDASPIVAGYIPIAIAFGILASQVGLGLPEATAMSVFVFAGSAQLIAVGMIGEGASMGTIVFTTFLVNLRHLLMSSALSPYLRGLSRKELAWFGFQVTDETFALHSTKFRVAVPSALESFALNGTAQLSWIVGTIVGVLAGGMIKDVEGLGLDYALPAMFIALVFLQMRNNTYFIVGVIGGTAAIFLQLVGFGSWSTIGATTIAATLGVVIEQWKK
ncbi:MAG: AzlC family ABC transporter permease [ANME-2 cluster archaeon]|nr:AzlC family ABC transporter permease [ANME-2 cluster archaeon]